MSDQPRSGRRRLSYANVTSTIALMLAISGGTAFAATRLITGKQIAKGTITAANIKSGSLLSKDFKRGQIPRGATGATGATGGTGATGATGAAGSAVAEGNLMVNSTGNAAFGSGSVVGFTTAFSPQSGVYCIALPAGVTNPNTPLSITDNSGQTGQFEQFSNAQCQGSGFEVSGVGGATLSSGSGGLSIIVP